LQRRGDSSQWSESNPILAPGEIGLEVDTQTFKIGDGLTSWDDLPYASGPVGASAYEVAVLEGFVGTEQEWVDSLSGYGVAVENGFTGTKQEWLDSLSGYGIAVENGFTGTKQEWLDSLIGPQGEIGEGLKILGQLNNESELPVSENVGDAYIIGEDLYVWNGSVWSNTGKITGPTGANVEVSNTPPSGIITPGTLWYDSQTGNTYIYFSDGDSFQWVQL